MNPRDAGKRLDKKARQTKVAQFILSGLTDQRTIAEKLGVSQPTISGDIKAVEAMWQEKAARDIQTAKGLDLARIERAITALWPGILIGDPVKVAQFVKLLARKAAMLGYDAPKVIDLQTAARRELMRSAREHGLTDAEVAAIEAEVESILAAG